jgi:hypothetical protein
MCPHTAIYVSSYYYTCVPHTNICSSSSNSTQAGSRRQASPAPTLREQILQTTPHSVGDWRIHTRPSGGDEGGGRGEREGGGVGGGGAGGRASPSSLSFKSEDVDVNKVPKDAPSHVC